MKKFGNTTFYGKINGAIHTGSGNIHIGGEKSRSFTKGQLAQIFKSKRHRANFEKHFKKLTTREKQQFQFDMKTYGSASMPWRE